VGERGEETRLQGRGTRGRLPVRSEPNSFSSGRAYEIKAEKENFGRGKMKTVKLRMSKGSVVGYLRIAGRGRFFYQEARVRGVQ